jgi:hypothetical protein
LTRRSDPSGATRVVPAIAAAPLGPVSK